MDAQRIGPLFAALAKSPFRRRFQLGQRERLYVRQKGLPIVLDHARGFIEKKTCSHNASE
jgi:Domain of unknown function (DUF4186)